MDLITGLTGTICLPFRMTKSLSPSSTTAASSPSPSPPAHRPSQQAAASGSHDSLFLLSEEIGGGGYDSLVLSAEEGKRGSKSPSPTRLAIYRVTMVVRD